MPRTPRVGKKVLQELKKIVGKKKIVPIPCCSTRPGQIHTFEVRIDGTIYGVHHLKNLASRRKKHWQAYTRTFLVRSSTLRQEGGKYFFLDVKGYSSQMVFLSQGEIVDFLRGRDRAIISFKLK